MNAPTIDPNNLEACRRLHAEAARLGIDGFEATRRFLAWYGMSLIDACPDAIDYFTDTLGDA